METGVYVDVLLVVNYAVNLLLLACAAKLAGRKSRGRRIVAAALLGSVSSLAIFLPFLGFLPSILLKLGVSAGMVLLAFRWISPRVFLKEWFFFFAVTFCFAGVMLGLWMAFRPSGMLYYNGVVYFDISAVTLLVTTVIAYCVMELIHRLSRHSRVREEIYGISVSVNGRTVKLRGLVDTGNSLCEPFSGIPVVICSLESIAAVLPPGTAELLLKGGFAAGLDCGMPLRGIPYSDVGGDGLLPAFQPAQLTLSFQDKTLRVERAYIAVSNKPVGDERYEAILNPDLIGLTAIARNNRSGFSCNCSMRKKK